MQGAEAGCNARGDANYRAQLVAYGHALPSDVVSNADYIERCRFTPARGWDELAETSRMRQRLWCGPQENTWTLTRAAVRNLCASHPELAREVDLVLVASGTTMNMAHPSDPENPSFADLAPLVLRELGREDAMGLDIKACYCTGFLRGVQAADALLANPNYRVALLVAAEQGSRFATSPNNQSSFAYIVADAAGAVAFRRTSEARFGVTDYCGYTDVSKLDWVGIGPEADTITMLGSRAAEATQRMLLGCATQLLRRNRLAPEEVDWFLPIQTHGGLVEAVSKELGFRGRQLLWSGGETGFSGSASIPVRLSQAVQSGEVKRGQLVLSVAVGAGMNCAGALYHA